MLYSQFMGKTPMHTVRVDDDLWERFGLAVAAAEVDRSSMIRQFIRWYVRESGPLPPRPERA